ncbi:hypothetical protein BCR43DRAFT_297024 [Syncephalastrum racemosum]|uniref:Uncharacterized protein n=1 Tax=Syncephalastrum racemosum TaxID=13706 RepID=A0A1X2H9E7_SYNRA|nr:hypothetical protein BCR43DRAFT_297024 [Syncephalastrum racemosum]
MDDVDRPRLSEGGEDTDMVNALNKLRALETLHDFDIGLQKEQDQTHQEDDQGEEEESVPEPPMTQSPAASPSPSPSAENEPTTPPLEATPIKKKQPDIRRCRLPQPSFIVKEQEALSLTAQEKVMSVLRKRQTITDEHRSQGSRLPMLKAMTLPSMKSRKPVSAPPSTANNNKKVVRRAKSVRLPKETEEKPSKPLRSHSMYKKSLNATTPPPAPPVKRPESSREKRESSLRSPKPRVLFAAGVDEPKKRPSAYRKKRLPPGESRTARLMMGISTTGRDTSKQRRPLSLVPEATRTTPLPRAEKSSRRQSTPSTSKKSSDVVPTKSAALKSAKVVRVH